MNIKEPPHDATIVEIAEYFRAVHTARANAVVPGSTAAERHAAEYARQVSQATAGLWKLRGDYERALNAKQIVAVDGYGPESSGLIALSSTGRTDYFREVAHAPTADAGKVPAHGGKIAPGPYDRQQAVQGLQPQAKLEGGDP